MPKQIFLKRWFLQGLIIAVPAVLTIFVFHLIIVKTDEALGFLWTYWPKKFYPPHFPGLGLLLVTLFLIGLGALTESVVVRNVLSLINYVLGRVPFIRSIYPTLLRLMQSIFGGGNSYTKAVLVEYPRVGTYALAFVTSNTAPLICKRLGKKLINLYVPTSPIPTSGYYIMVAEDQIIELNITPEEAFKLILSAGIVAENHDNI